MTNGAPDIINLDKEQEAGLYFMPELRQTIDYVNENSALLPAVGELFNNNETMSKGLKTVMKEHPKAYGDMFKEVFENPEISQNLNTALIDATTEISHLDVEKQEGAYTKLFQSFVETPEGKPLSQEQMKAKLTDFTASSNDYTNEVASADFKTIESNGLEDIQEAFTAIKENMVNNKDLPMAYRESFHNVFGNMEKTGGLFMNEEFLESMKQFAMDNAKAFMGRMSNVLKTGVGSENTEKTSLALQSNGGPAVGFIAKFSPGLPIVNVAKNGTVSTMSAAELAGLDPSIEDKLSRPNNHYTTQAPDVRSLETPSPDSGIA